jgi:hypothetical protein
LDLQLNSLLYAFCMNGLIESVLSQLEFLVILDVVFQRRSIERSVSAH